MRRTAFSVIAWVVTIAFGLIGIFLIRRYDDRIIVRRTTRTIPQTIVQTNRVAVTRDVFRWVPTYWA